MSDFISALISHFGSQASTAKALGVSQPTVSYWLSGYQKISAEKAILAQVKSGGAIFAADLCPLLAEVVALQALDKASIKIPSTAPGCDGAVNPSSIGVA